MLRVSFPQITAPGGLLDASLQLYPLLGAKLNHTSLTWHFPSGAKVVFRPLKFDKDVLNFQGAEIPAIAFDELCQFSEYQFWYLLSRNRSTCGVRPYIRGTCNPDPDSFVRVLIDWYLTTDGYPDPDRIGQVRYFIRENGQLKFVEPDWRDLETGLQAKTLTFIPSSVHDNPALLTANPEYLLTLKSLPEVERLQLLGGN
jgi:Terminase large subunit, T4likevirus-type, N-terminal